MLCYASASWRLSDYIWPLVVSGHAVVTEAPELGKGKGTCLCVVKTY